MTVLHGLWKFLNTPLFGLRWGAEASEEGVAYQPSHESWLAQEGSRRSPRGPWNNFGTTADMWARGDCVGPFTRWREDWSMDSNRAHAWREFGRPGDIGGHRP